MISYEPCFIRLNIDIGSIFHVIPHMKIRQLKQEAWELGKPILVQFMALVTAGIYARDPIPVDFMRLIKVYVSTLSDSPSSPQTGSKPNH